MRAAATHGSWLQTQLSGDATASLRSLWRVGTRVEAVVLERLAEQTYLMRSGGLEWVAQSELPLKEKQRIHARVRSMEPVISLQLVGPQHDAAESPASDVPTTHLVVVEFDDRNRVPVELSYRRGGKKGRRGNVVHHVAMLLELDNFGTIGVRATLNGNYATLDVHCEDIDVAEALQENAGDLERSLSLAKIVLSNLSIDLWPEEPPQVGSGEFQPKGYERIDWTV